MKRRGTHLRLVPTFETMPPALRPRRQLPPLKPLRPVRAVRLSLRAALDVSASLHDTVKAVNPREPAQAGRAIGELRKHSQRLARLVDELQSALDCEMRYECWKRGKPYVE